MEAILLEFTTTCQASVAHYQREALKIQAFRSAKQKVTKSDNDKLGGLFIACSVELEDASELIISKHPKLEDEITTIFKLFNTQFLEFTRSLQDKKK